MHYLIDGYNFFFRLEEDVLPLEEKREAFIAILELEVSSLHLKASLVFDSHHKNAQGFASKRQFRNIEVIFSPKNLSADEYILELLEWNSKNTTLVTSDQRLAKKAAALGAKTQSIEAFVKFILHKKKRSSIPEKSEFQESPENIKRLLKAFEENDES